MYKSGKQWLVAGMATFALVGAAQVVTGHAPIDFGQNITAHAADSTTNYWMGQNTEYYKRYSELPQNSSVPESTQAKWGYASGEIVNMRNNTKFVFDGLTYDKASNKYILKAELRVPQLTTGGAGRTSYFDMGFSDSLSAKTSNPHLSAANGNQSDLSPINGVYHNDFNAGGTVGGTSTITVAIDPVKVLPTDQITAMYSSDTGTTGYHAIFSVVRTLGYDDFGAAFNNTLIAQMKQNSTDAINNSKLSDKQKTAEQAKVNAVTTDDDFVNKLQAIDKDVQAKSAANAVPIDQQRATALQQYKDAHNVDKILNEIANDSTLTKAQKDAQSKQVNDAVAVIKGNLDKATDSDDVATAIADTSQDNAIATAYQPGTDLATQIKNAQDAIDAQLVKSKALVDDNTNLTDNQKTAQKTALGIAATTAKNNIGTKINADDISTAQTAGIKNLTDLDTAKPAAYTTLTNKANSAISTINNDQNLTDAQKQDRINQVNTALKGITDKIDQATDATTVNNLAGSADLDNAIATATSDSGVTPIANQRDSANKQIDQYVTDTKAKIDADNNLTSDEKKTQKANVDQAASDAKTAIANGSAQVVADTVARAQGTIAGQYVAGKPLPDRQKEAEQQLQNTADTAKSNLDAQVAQANNDINNNNYLTDAQKQAQKDAIQKAAQSAINQINNATDADAVNNALVNGQNVVSNLNAQKLAARTAVNKAVQNAEATVNNNNALTADQKKDRIDQIEEAKTAAGNTIDSATDADVISGVPASGSTFDQAIKAATDFSNVTSLDGQKDAAKAALDTAGQNAKNALDAAKTAQENAIDQDGNLTPEQKTAQKAAIDQAVTNAKSDISNATNADDVTKAKDTAVIAISNLSGEKTAARQALAKQAQAAIDTINGNNALTAADKASRIKQVQDAYNTATSAVDAATTAADVTAAQNSTDFSGAIAKATDFTGIQSLDGQKADAQKALDTAGQNAKDALDAAKVAQENAIDKDGNLTPEQKAAQKAAIDQAVSNAKSDISNATNADGVAKAKDAGITAISNLSGEKTAARQALATQA
ncbi:Chromosome segregation ATPase Smc (Smc) [Fructobacillus evanidus]|nr:Chromosome segregation ATPase Smc (Smc) [Fructobacillus sp. LMG 32999]CAK1229964.1 Chromosome segregation ATPase Smc (Smc) [Fructobacillus sp. LMG 32999]CAK1232738.1 Chromosome segregation ATPase Smc (Smc) [Fructobacillus sp. LMG 32999]CAK1234031.1 Chromosome segregation ATPase Smc (Smc) [Fructobacillus sp. LMG 32999]CAK1242602.1 Chromosome segregation ATPase Smc (Smc) [Fructobacillus sp. LMG 32999]